MPQKKRPLWKDLKPHEQKIFGNGAGPAWLPNFVRCQITKSFARSFDEMIWREHDFGYCVGRTENDRLAYDIRLKIQMLQAIKRFKRAEWAYSKAKAHTFYRSIRFFGWSTFNFGTEYDQIDEAKIAASHRDSHCGEMPTAKKPTVTS